MTTSALLLSMTLAMTAAAPPKSPVAVDVQARDAAGRTDATLEQQLEGKLREALSKQGVVVDGDATARRVVVSVRKVDVIDYEVEVRVEVDGVAREPGVPGFSCESCRVVELYDRVLERVPQMVEAVAVEEEAEPAVETEPEPTAEPDPEPEDDGAPEPATERVEDEAFRRVGVAGYVGIAAAGVGLVVTAAGVPVLLEQPGEMLRPSDLTVIDTTHRRPLGWALVGSGAGLVVTGVVLIAVDQTVLRKRRRQRHRDTAVVPSFSNGGVGLAWTGRF